MYIIVVHLWKSWASHSELTFIALMIKSAKAHKKVDISGMFHFFRFPAVMQNHFSVFFLLATLTHVLVYCTVVSRFKQNIRQNVNVGVIAVYVRLTDACYCYSRPAERACCRQA